MEVLEKGNKRNLILDTTLGLLSERGFHATPISMIAEKANIGAGTIYRYFKNKDELINELFIEIKRRLITAMYQGYDESLDYKERFYFLWLNMINYYHKKPKEFLYLEQHSYAPYVSNLTRSESMKILMPVLMFFLEGKKNKHIVNLPLYTIIGLVYGPISSIVKLNLDHNNSMTKEQINDAANACWNAVMYRAQV